MGRLQLLQLDSVPVVMRTQYMPGFSRLGPYDPALLDRVMLRKGAEEAGVPCIAFKYAENSGQFQQFREQAGTFADSIKLWGEA